MIKLLRLLQGYVVFEACGGFVERFLNLCKINGINLWNVKNDGVKVVAFTSAVEFMKLSVPAERSGMEINVIRKCGFPFFIKNHKWRCGAVFGALLVVLFIWFLSGFIWNVEIVSTDGVKIDGFTAKIEQLGVKTGARKSEIDILAVQEQLLDSFSELSWVSLNIFGTKAQIEYTYAKPQVPIADKNALTNVIALKSGKVVLVEGYSGVNVIKNGEYVTEGSLLISGIIKNADFTESFVHASGKVFAETENLIKKEIFGSQIVSIATEQPSLFKFNFFGVEIPFGREKEEAFSNTTPMLLEGNNTTLPIGFIRCDFLSFQEQEVALSEEECKLRCLLECVLEKRNLYSEAELRAVDFSVSQEGDKTTVSAEIKCVENIAVESPVIVDEN